MNRHRLLLFAILVFLAATAFAQVPSYSLDDVPPGSDALFMTYTGGFVRMHPNHQIAYVQTGPNEQKVWFSIDAAIDTDAAHPGPNHPYYNRRYRADSSSPWYWEYSLSQPIQTIVGFVDTVLYYPLPRYTDASGWMWKYIMYSVNQPSLCNGNQFGYAMVQYSNDGINWTHTSPLHHEGGPSSNCAPELGGSLVAVEALDAIDDGEGTIWLVGMEGNVTTLLEIGNMDQTFASWGKSSYASTSDVTIDASTCMISNSGIFSPALPNAAAWRFRTYSYFFNTAIAWDAANGDLYWSRGYPYPFDRYATIGWGQFVPSPDVTPNPQVKVFNPFWGVTQAVEGCAPSPGIYPNRHQIYKMHLGSLIHFPYLHTETWTFVDDRGYSSGYLQDAALPRIAQLVPGQTPGSRDAGAASFLRDNQGNLVRVNGSGYVFGASTLMSQMSAGPCRVTGNEGIVAEPIP